jgi:hypothetical protein
MKLAKKLALKCLTRWNAEPANRSLNRTRQKRRGAFRGPLGVGGTSELGLWREEKCLSQ